MNSWKKVLLPVLAIAWSGALLAQSSTTPGDGTWVLNIAKSSYKPKAAAPQSETRTYATTPDGVQVTVHQVIADGTAVTETSTYKLDGKPYAFTGSPNVDTVEVTRINARESRNTLMRNGKTIGHLTQMVSKDGKTLTQTVTIRRAATGKTQHEVRVYDRQ